jgi:hypothetical protein
MKGLHMPKITKPFGLTEKKALELCTRYSYHTRAIARLKALIGASAASCTAAPANHLAAWYTPERSDEGTLWPEITEEEHGAQCAACYAAHVAVEARKRHKRKLAAVKAAITKGGA